MHELPKDLTNSLRSWRGSAYGEPDNLRDSPSVLEKGPEYYGDKEFERALSPSDRSIILHPTASRQALNQVAQQQQQPPSPPQSHEQQQLANQQALQHHEALDQLHDLPPPRKPSVQTRLPPKKQATMQTPASAAKQSIFDQAKVEDPDSAANRLDDDLTPLAPEDFYELMGMRAPPDKQTNPKNLALRNGLYSRIQKAHHYIQTKYRLFDVFTYIFLLLQLILSAVFIILGSLTRVNTNIAIVVLGAVSTIIAGALTIMKGQGLPNRLRHTRDGLNNVIFEAEELYWDVGASKPVLYKDVKKLRTDFLRVMEEARKNHPDTWNSISQGVATGLKPPSRATNTSVPAAATPHP
ncbi:hypothetical protein BAUCODRAFT_147904 [Baudoinia panamericana UAMH 10762]|uniref:SMODS and SLOG-associating 2TM effector domain-containing protein n=1 Tax=Baudoinia panamericana (strain UAMH 10762) TaxID=717646 RepID=M2MHZ9_BAUPA|nr:uncharacterized protein BAUCODRAFT_147904 [Baudoinia panamericana UAMH 10762]EMC96271.1 hypothetical protein BAUCODRAFT_147904 [Baudoinia panamericana UAMH 10762]